MAQLQPRYYTHVVQGQHTLGILSMHLQAPDPRTTGLEHACPLGSCASDIRHRGYKSRTTQVKGPDISNSFRCRVGGVF